MARLIDRSSVIQATGMLVAAALLLAAAGGCKQHPRPPTADPQAAERVLTTRGAVANVLADEDRVSFDLRWTDQQFVFDTADAPDAAVLVKALEAAEKAGRSVQVKYSIDSGFIEAGTGKPSYVVREFIDQGRSLRGMAAPGDYRGDIRRTAARVAERALVRGVALLDGQEYAAARSEVEAALADVRADRGLQAMAYKVRGRARQAQVEASESAATLAGDRELLAALQDFRAWADLEPGNAEPRYAVAGALQALGAYDEAVAVYESIRREWLDEDYWTAIRIGAVYRERGDLAQALAALDGLVAVAGPQSGMPFHYHRGWTLLQLDRYAEAADEFTSGLKYQPDYAWAALRRACAHAMQGAIAEALADQTQGLALLRVPDSAPTTAADRQELAHATAVVTVLRAALAANSQGALAAPCEGYPGDARDRARRRSVLLPVQPPP